MSDILLTKAWACLLTPEHVERSQQGAIDHGEGISFYNFLPPGTDAEGNCEYYYADKGCTLWNTLVGNMPNKHVFEREYKHSSMYAVCVSVPSPDLIQSIKVFRRDTHDVVIDV